MVKEFLKGNERFRDDVFRKNKELFARLKEGQSPKAIWFGCSDSRVVPEAITSSMPGTIFVKRDIANIVPVNDKAVGALLEYALEHLRVPKIVVCGHYNCGGVNALFSKHSGHLAGFLEYAVDARKAVENALGAQKPGEEDLRRLVVEANVLLQIGHLMSYKVVAEALEQGRVEVHGLVYDLHDGKLHENFPALNEFGLFEKVRKAFG